MYADIIPLFLFFIFVTENNTLVFVDELSSITSFLYFF